MSSFGSEPGLVEKVLLYGLMPIAMILLFVTLSQPAWRGQEMLAEMRSNCDKVGGIMLETEGMFVNTYECSPRYDQGVKR